MDTKKFTPAWWLRNAHLQTLWPTLCRNSSNTINLIRERFELPDGDFIDGDWVNKKKSAPIVLILTGLEGSSKSHYVQRLLPCIQQQGWQSLIVHFRGCSGELNRLPRTYHAGDTGDLSFVAQTLRWRFPTVPIAAVGFSLGGNVLLKWLGETGVKNPLFAAIAVSAPLILQRTVLRLNQGLSRIYQRYLLNHLRKKIRWKFSVQTPPFGLFDLNSLTTLRDFDNRITAPLHGFFNAEEYYTKSSCYPYLENIQVPTLLIQAKDDPFMLPHLPVAIPNTSFLHQEITAKGGHLGFISGYAPWRCQHWLKEGISEFLQGTLRQWRSLTEVSDNI
jgi:predicted alpha/beta-fold hydrolase